MSKSNADFSAFDFNDSSDNSDIQTRGPYLSRASLSNNSLVNNNTNNSASSSSSNNGNSNDSQNLNNVGGTNDEHGIAGGSQIDTDIREHDGDINGNNSNDGNSTIGNGTHTNANNTDGLLMGAMGPHGGTINTAAGTVSNAMESNNSNCAVAGLLDGALGGSSNNCNNELVRSSSASLSNNSTSTNHGGGTGGGLGGGGGGGSSLCSVGGGSVAGSTSASERKKYRHQNYSKNIYIGTKNAEKWEHTRSRLQFKNDVEFVAYLLNLADKDTERLANLPALADQNSTTKSFANNFKLEPNLSAKEFNTSQAENGDSQPTRKKSKKRVQFSDALNGFPKMKDFSNFAMKAKKHDQKMKNVGSNGDLLPEVLDCRIAEKIKSELEEKSASKESLPNALCLKKGDEQSDEEDDDDENTNAGASTITDAVDGINGQNSNFRMRIKNKKNSKGMAPPNSYNNLNANPEDDEDEGEDSECDDDDEEMDEEAMAREMKNEQNFVEEEDEHDIAFRSHQSCRECSITHDQKMCPLRNAMSTITDAVDLAEWIERKNLEALAKLKADAHRHAKQDHDDDEDMDETSQMSELETKPLITFAEASVPAEFELHNVEPNVTGVFVRSEVRAFTKLGPLIGQKVETTEVREGSDMKWIFEICEAGAEKSQLLSCENPNTSNWLRYIRPAPTYDERNVNLVSIERQAYFVTCTEVKNGMELLYWSDECNTMWRKKHTEKINCGGCNLKFDHPLYYRTHCSVFHDPSMSLTIRKYHCKVCGEAVLGKDNITKHAAEKHDGKGAYQCQFCNKFFLRLNYLEMHRTYGCAANPNRARPLCDFCGRKFCQPQKLKAHIKRMHSGKKAQRESCSNSS
ncbi:probable cyclin-dependent serine/threonine-protein kinase DDB_G0292550 [Teleopsis dalmanni]|uniref:probable cyclin-dependent serine/threonine-protein kinase DDB_G0292550 n=1 Tax=Teleopsis dalmanni TaxID=139649 RepID=UPI0018CFBF43|nr:probable cyclin-dependent serine/threonine-protein kinase DDB_G0292550 [Teleopsis dalmanni]